MANAFQVASYLIRLASDEAEPTFLTHLHLQKLLYYTQGWSLALKGRSAFGEPIEAWTNGPVVRAVYPKFADFRNRPIEDFDTSSADQLSADDRFMIAAVWEHYKGASAIQLRNQTHQESPWLLARNGIPPRELSSAVITTESMVDFFSTEVQAGKPAPIVAKAHWDNPKMASDFIESAQSVFIRNADLLSRLAK